jgi:hypothetical protein
MTSTAEIVAVDVADLLSAAQARAELQGELNGSMRGMQANQVGALGELVGMQYLANRGVEYEEVFSTAYDLRFTGNGGSQTLEFKTKERTVAPLSSYDVTVPAYNHEHQRPDYYFFISLHSSGKSDDIRRFTRAYILGIIGLKDFDAKATRWTPDQVDESNNWKPTIECLNVKVRDLLPL